MLLIFDTDQGKVYEGHIAETLETGEHRYGAGDDSPTIELEQGAPIIEAVMTAITAGCETVQDFMQVQQELMRRLATPEPGASAFEPDDPGEDRTSLAHDAEDDPK